MTARIRNPTTKAIIHTVPEMTGQPVFMPGLAPQRFEYMRLKALLEAVRTP